MPSKGRKPTCLPGHPQKWNPADDGSCPFHLPQLPALIKHSCRLDREDRALQALRTLHAGSAGSLRCEGSCTGSNGVRRANDGPDAELAALGRPGE